MHCFHGGINAVMLANKGTDLLECIDSISGISALWGDCPLPFLWIWVRLGACVPQSGMDPGPQLQCVLAHAPAYIPAPTLRPDSRCNPSWPSIPFVSLLCIGLPLSCLGCTSASGLAPHLML